GGVAVGYALGRLLPSPEPSNGTSWADSSASAHAASAPAYSQQESTGGGISSFLHGLQPVVDKLKGLALATAATVVGEMIVKNLPDNLKSEVTNLIDDTTRRLGGTVLHEKW